MKKSWMAMRLLRLGINTGPRVWEAKTISHFGGGGGGVMIFPIEI